MTLDHSAKYLPPELIDEARGFAPQELSDNEMYSLERLLERVYARGYDDGHRRGQREAWDHRTRPNVNEVNEIREQIRVDALEKKEQQT